MTSPSSDKWRDRAACAGASSDIFFPTRDGNVSVRAALSYCGICPVQEECLEYELDYALNNGYDFGVWGGTTNRQRRAIRAERNSPRFHGDQRKATT